jgi:hypothetical protein
VATYRLPLLRREIRDTQKLLKIKESIVTKLTAEIEVKRMRQQKARLL